MQELQCMHRFHKEVKHYLRLFLCLYIEKESLPFRSMSGSWCMRILFLNIFYLNWED